jgi:hypothetical protein
MKVSILTITQITRHESVKLLIDYIQNQTYKNIVEWIIVDGSKNNDDSTVNKIMIENLNIICPKIIYKNIENKEINKTDIIKNLSNEINGDIIICMDDDDYYFPSFIEYTVSKLNISNKNIGSAQSLYVYDIILNKTFKIIKANLPFAYKKNFNVDDETENLLSEYLMIKLIHNNNHFFNKAITYSASISNIENVHKLEDEIINYLIPDKYFEKYKEIFDLLDSDKDGYISSRNIRLSSLDSEMLFALTPLLEEIQKKSLTLSFKDFCLKADTSLSGTIFNPNSNK